MAKPAYGAFAPMRIQAAPGSAAERKYYEKSALPGGKWPAPKALAPGVNPAPLEDLMFHGGKTVPQMEFQNIYLGGTASWDGADIASIDDAIVSAMQDRRLNNVVGQYFPGQRLACDMRESFVLDEEKPVRIDEPAVQKYITDIYDAGLIAKRDLSTALFNLILPSGTTLRLDSSTSLGGLGGYHGSVHIKRNNKPVTLYYSANVYSEIDDNGRQNGIVAFNRPWKNVVGTLYHEINEFRTDADVNDAIQHGDNDFLGWTSRQGQEIGDQPIFAAATLDLVFKEIAAAKGGKRLPVQFLYSNAVHGAEGPIETPHA
jgi:hypothetical protein